MQELKEQERKQREQEKKIKYRALLEAQMKQNAHNRRVAPMSETEKKINHGLLDRVHNFQATGVVAEQDVRERH